VFTVIFLIFDNFGREINHGGRRLIMVGVHLTMAGRHVKRPCGEHCILRFSYTCYIL